MKNFYNRLETAIELHYLMSNEKITKTYLAAVLWPNSTLKTQRTRLSQTRHTGLNMTIEQLDALLEAIPTIPSSYWRGDCRVAEAKQKLMDLYTVDEVTNDIELNLLWILLQSDLYSETLTNKFLR